MSLRIAGVLRRLPVFAVALMSVAGAAQPITAEQKADVLKAVEDTITQRAFIPGVDFAKWNEFLDRHRAAIDAAADISAFATEVNRALREFGASHIRLQTPRAAQNRNRTTATGVGISARPAEEGLRVVSVAETGPARGAGIAPGDVIVEVNGKKPTDPEELTSEEGKEIAIKVKNASGEVRDVVLKAASYSTVRKETLTWVDSETAVLRVFTFAAGYGRENIEALMKDAAKAKYLILDLRSNGGGSTNNLNHLASLLLPPDTVIGTFVSRRMADRFTTETGKPGLNPVEIAQWSTQKFKTQKRSIEPFSGKVAVLINRGTGSASEITAMALREQKGAILVGQSSAGAVLASVFGRLPHGFQIQYPVSDYVSAKGARLEKAPLVPDVVVEERPENGKDPALEKAVEAVKKQKSEPALPIAA